MARLIASLIADWSRVASRYFVAEVYVVAAGVITATIISALLYTITVRHHEREETRKACAFAAKALMQARPFLRNVVAHPDPCAYLARMRGEPI